MSRARRNTEIYRDIFRCEPDNSQINFQKLKDDRKYIKDLDPKEFLDKYMELKDEIKGHFVEYPTEYLSKQSLALSITSFTKLVPVINFV